MLKSVTHEIMYGVKSTLNSFEKDHPGEQVIFSSATTLSEFNGQSRRGIVRRGVVIFTERQVFFKSVLLSLYTLIYILAVLVSFWSFYRTQNYIYLILGILIGAMTIQRWPLQRQIAYEDINESEFTPVQGNLLSGGKNNYKLKIVTEDKVVFFALTQNLPDEIRQSLGINSNFTNQRAP